MKTKNDYRGLPFWSWNGKLDKGEITRQVHILKEMGFGGFFMHSRTGLETEYLGEEWFECIKAATEEAKELGMSAWLYDEDRWPSGTAGGEITKKLEYQLKFISMYDADAKDFDAYVACELGRFAIKLDGNNIMSDYYAIKEGETPKEGYVVKKFLVEHMAGQEFYNGYTYIDTMNEEAVQAFINSTHEKYKEKCGGEFGKTILGIFTDEPHRGSIMNGFGINNKNRYNMMPYTYKLFERYNEICGGNLQNSLPELYFMKKGEKVNRAMYFYIETLQELFLECYAIPYNEWCKKNKLIATGHILHEDSLAIQTVFSGSVQRYYEHMGYPGVDVLTEGNRAYYVAKQVQSVARQMGKPFVLSELYGCTGWQMNFKSHRDVGAWQTLLGINLRCHHLSWYTMKGEAKRDYPASIFYQSGWYKDYGYIEDYFARLGEIVSTGKPLCSTLVINPVESMWLYPRLGWQNVFTLKYSETIRLEQDYFNLFKILTTGQIDFDYGDEDILKRHYSVKIIDGKPTLCVGDACYTTVVLSGMDTVRSTTLNILEEFVRIGGDVLFVGYLPEYVDAEKAELPSSLLKKCSRVNLDRSDVLDYLRKHQFFNINSSEIMTTVRKDGGNYYLVCLNEDRENKKENLTLTLNKKYNVEGISLDCDREFGVVANSESFQVSFEPGECKVFRVFEKGNILPILKEKKEKETAVLNIPFRYSLSEMNVLPLDMPSFVLDGEENEEDEILQVDRKIRKKIGLPCRGGEMIQPWYREKYALIQKQQTHKITLKYKFNIEVLPQEDLFFIIEDGLRWKIKVNGKSLEGNPVGYWIDTCFDKFVLPCSMLCMGENELELFADYDDTLNLECVYIIGNFGVRVDGKIATVCALPKTLEVGDISNQGLPFYSGTVTYYTGVKGNSVSLKLGDCYGATSKVSCGEVSEYIAFAPYESQIFNCNDEIKIEVILTRRNTFGPLHYAPILSSMYGPDIFIEQGENYTSNYCLIKQGLLDAPTIKRY